MTDTCENIVFRQLHLRAVINQKCYFFLGKIFATRMHSSGMRTVRNSSLLLSGVSTSPGAGTPPPAGTTPGAEPPEQALPLEQAPPGAGPPAARHAGIPPAMHARIAHQPTPPPPPRTESQTSVKT